MMAPKRRTKRKAVVGAGGVGVQACINRIGIGASAEPAVGTSSGAGGGLISPKRKRKASEAEADSGEGGEGEALLALDEKIGAIQEIIDLTDNVEELCLIQQKWIQLKKYLQTKIQDRRTFLEAVKVKDELQLSIRKGHKKPPHALLNEVVLKRLATYVPTKELPNCRLVCTKWNQVMSTYLRSTSWTSLSFDPPKPNDPDYPLSLKDFLTEIKPGSSMFPSTMFTLLLNRIPPTVNQFFSIYSEHIKKLELRYHPPRDASDELDIAIMREVNMQYIESFLVPAIPNCEHLYLSDLTCQVYTNATTTINLPKKMNLKNLDVEMICRCDHDENRHFLTSNTFLTRLLMLNQQLESLVIFLDSSNYSTINMQRIVTMILSYVGLGSLKHLSLRSEKLIQLNWSETQPSIWQLKALELRNVILAPLQIFLEHHANSLVCLNVDIDETKWDSLRINFHNQVYSAPKLKNLKTLSLVCLEDQEENLSGILRAETFPELQKLRILSVNDAFIQAHNAQRNQHHDDDNDSDDEAGYENQIQVKFLDLEIDEQDSPSDYHFLRHTFYGVQHLILTTCQSRFMTPLWTSGFPLKTLELRVTDDDDQHNDSDEFYIQHLDTILTGYSVNDCERVYQHIQRTFHSPGGFQLATFNVDSLEGLTKDKEYPSVRNFSRLQRLVINCSRNSSRLTEVTLATVLLWLKSLTAISISHCSISQNFVKSIRGQLPPGFFLDIDGVEI